MKVTSEYDRLGRLAEFDFQSDYLDDERRCLHYCELCSNIECFLTLACLRLVLFHLL